MKFDFFFIKKMNIVDRGYAYRQAKRELRRQFGNQYYDYIHQHACESRGIPIVKLRSLTLQYADYKSHKGKMQYVISLEYAIQSTCAVFTEASERRVDIDRMLDFLPAVMTTGILRYIDWE